MRTAKSPDRLRPTVVGAEDQYTVTRLSDGGYQVKHYPHEKAPLCCNVSVTITDRDRDQVFEFERVKGSTSALARAYAAIANKHEVPVSGNV